MSRKGNCPPTPVYHWAYTKISDSFWTFLLKMRLTIDPGERVRLGRTTTRLAG